MTTRSFPRIFTANFVAPSVLVEFPSSVLISQRIMAGIQRQTDTALANGVQLVLPFSWPSLVLRESYVINRWNVSFIVLKWTCTVVSWEKTLSCPQHQFKFTLGSQDALFSMPAPIVFPNFSILELEEIIQPSSLLAAGRLPCI